MPFEMSDEFPLISEHLGIRDFSRTSCQNTDTHLPGTVLICLTQLFTELPLKAVPISWHLRGEDTAMDHQSLMRWAGSGDMRTFVELTGRFQHLAFGSALALVHDF